MWEKQREEMWKYSLRIEGEERRGLPQSESWTVEPHNSSETQKDVRPRSGTGIAKAGACEASSGEQYQWLSAWGPLENKTVEEVS